MSSFSNPSRTQRSDPSRIAPFLTNVVTHHGQLTLIPPQNAGRIRKGGKKALLERARTERERRRDDEPRFNTAAPASPRAANRRANHAERSPRAPPAVTQRFSRDTMIPDYPPPSFQEAMMTPPFIPPAAADVQETQVHEPEPANENINPPPVQEPRHAELHISTSSPSISTPTSGSPSTAGATPTPPSSSHSHSHSLDTPTETTPDASPNDDSPQSHSQAASGSDTASEDSSIELVSLDADAYDLSQRLAGPLRCRAARIHRRQHPSHSSSPSHSHAHTYTHSHHKETHGMQTPRHVAHLSIDVDDAQERGRCSRCGSPTPEDCSEILPDEVSPLPLPLPTNHSHHSPPSSPKSSKWKRLFVPTSSGSGGNKEKEKEKEKESGEVPMTPMTPMSPMLASPKSSRFGFLPGALASTLTLSSPSSSFAPSSSSSPSKPSPNKPFANGQKREKEKELSVMRRIFSPKGKDKDRDPQKSLGGLGALGGMGGSGLGAVVNVRDSVDWEFIDKEVPSVDEDEDAGGMEDHHHHNQQRGGSPVEMSSSSSTSTSHHLTRTDTSRRNTREHRENHPPPHAAMPQPESREEYTAAAAFINRPVRHSPLALNPFPMFASNANSSVVSLPLTASKHTSERLQPNMHAPSLTPSNINGDPGRMVGSAANGIGTSSLARRQTLSTSHASPSVVWLPLITSEDGSVTVAGSPVVSSAMPFPPPNRMPMPPRVPASPVHARNPSAPPASSSASSLHPSHQGPGRAPPHVVTSPLAFSITPTYDYDEQSPSPSPTFTESPASALEDSPQDLPYPPSFSSPSFSDIRDREVRDTRRAAPPPLRSPASTSTLASTSTTTTTYDYDSGTSSPTTPTRHYHGRPLPQTPGPAGPFERAGHTPLFRPAFLPAVLSGGGQLASAPSTGQSAAAAPPPVDSDTHRDGYSASGPYEYSDLDVYAAQVVDSDDRDGGGRRYEDLLRIAEMAGPAVSPHTPHRPNKPQSEDHAESLALPPSGRVKLKLTLMEVVVDKCSICLSQFKEAEVACLGTRCPHAFHEYCLKRWIATRRSCPLCRAEI